MDEAKLARAKLSIMLQNLGGVYTEVCQASKLGLLKDEAYQWVFGKSDFELWCEMAGYDPVYVREKAKAIYENGLPRKSILRKIASGKMKYEYVL